MRAGEYGCLASDEEEVKREALLARRVTQGEAQGEEMLAPRGQDLLSPLYTFLSGGDGGGGAAPPPPASDVVDSHHTYGGEVDKFGKGEGKGGSGGEKSQEGDAAAVVPVGAEGSLEWMERAVAGEAGDPGAEPADPDRELDLSELERELEGGGGSQP